MSVPSKLFRLQLAMICVSALGATDRALAVDTVNLMKDAEPLSAVTTVEATRANADVQIRRIKNLIVSRKSDDARDYDRLEKLQRELHGQK